MENIIPHKHTLQLAHRIAQLRQQPKLIWFTGLSGSGKSTLANALEVKLFEQGYKTYLLDGDNIRSGLNQDLDFTDYGRQENIRRIGEVARLFLDAGLITLSAFISPFRQERELVKQLAGAHNFIEVYVKCALETCETRDVKGLYQKARRGEIKHFTGIDSPYEEPIAPTITLDTTVASLHECTQTLLAFVLPLIKASSKRAIAQT